MSSKLKLGARAVNAAKKPFKRSAEKFARSRYADDEGSATKRNTNLASLGHTLELNLVQQAQAERKLKDHKETVAGHNTRLQELENKRTVQRACFEALMKLEPQSETTSKVQSPTPKWGGGEDRLRQLPALPAKVRPESDIKRLATATGEKREVVIDEDDAHAHKKQRVAPASEARKVPGSAYQRQVQQGQTTCKKDSSQKLWAGIHMVMSNHSNAMDWCGWNDSFKMSVGSWKRAPL
ncbi:hypothetical protein AC579_2412 [Pseudocercospora musae]|uniref:Uncharacterized protein n=1 Tax=Pseudocercospora musae TaxID=113226 RepID=A0A139I9T2_9PEZI|nr:hypothetical protein AC579_2412 [Pseudocercospora musae]